MIVAATTPRHDQQATRGVGLSALEGVSVVGSVGIVAVAVAVVAIRAVSVWRGRARPIDKK